VDLQNGKSTRQVTMVSPRLVAGFGGRERRELGVRRVFFFFFFFKRDANSFVCRFRRARCRRPEHSACLRKRAPIYFYQARTSLSSPRKRGRNFQAEKVLSTGPNLPGRGKEPHWRGGRRGKAKNPPSFINSAWRPTRPQEGPLKPAHAVFTSRGFAWLDLDYVAAPGDGRLTGGTS